MGEYHSKQREHLCASPKFPPTSLDSIRRLNKKTSRGTIKKFKLSRLEFSILLVSKKNTVIHNKVDMESQDPEISDSAEKPLYTKSFEVLLGIKPPTTSQPKTKF